MAEPVKDQIHVTPIDGSVLLAGDLSEEEVFRVGSDAEASGKPGNVEQLHGIARDEPVALGTNGNRHEFVTRAEEHLRSGGSAAVAVRPRWTSTPSPLFHTQIVNESGREFSAASRVPLSGA